MKTRRQLAQRVPDPSNQRRNPHTIAYDSRNQLSYGKCVDATPDACLAAARVARKTNGALALPSHAHAMSLIHSLRPTLSGRHTQLALATWCQIQLGRLTPRLPRQPHRPRPHQSSSRLQWPTGGLGGAHPTTFSAETAPQLASENSWADPLKIPSPGDYSCHGALRGMPSWQSSCGS